MDTLSSGAQLTIGQSIVSPSGQFSLTLQNDGNLVLYQGTSPLWATNTQGQSSKNAVMQTDGNFVLYDASGTPLFASHTDGHPPAVLILQDDGNLVVYSFGQPLWSTHTNQPPQFTSVAAEPNEQGYTITWEGEGFQDGARIDLQLIGLSGRTIPLSIGTSIVVGNKISGSGSFQCGMFTKPSPDVVLQATQAGQVVATSETMSLRCSSA